MVVFAVWTSQKRAQIPFKPKMATTVLSSKEEQSRNSEDSDAGSERVKKPKKIPKYLPTSSGVVDLQTYRWVRRLSTFVEQFLTRRRK